MFKLFSKLIILFCALFLFSGEEVQCNEITDTVVKIFVTSNPMDYYSPWQSQGISISTGSGSIITGNQILTNAHVVADHTFIQVKKYGNPKKYTARLTAIDHDCDLATLTVDEPNFFDEIVLPSIWIR